jgi:hypothetical protein
VTHSLHREGSRENLSNDFTIYCLPAVGINDKGSGSKRWRFLEIALRNNAANAGQADIGNIIAHSPHVLSEGVKKRFENSAGDGVGDGMSPCICYSSKEGFVKILKETIEADLGLCIVVQGILEEVEDCLRQVGLKPHTVHHSLGVWGKTEKLLGKEVLEITTMCGHGMTSPSLVKKCIEEVISGKTTPREAARLLARPCICGIFNPDRAEALLKRIASRSEPLDV